MIALKPSKINEIVQLCQSSQVHCGFTIHILKISSNFYILLVSLRGATPENFCSIPLFVQILWLFEYFRVCLIFPVMKILGSNFQKFSNFPSLERYSLKYVLRLLKETAQNIHNFLMGIQKSEKS